MSQPAVKEESVDISLAKLPGRFTYNRRTRKKEWSTTLPVILRDLAPTSGFDPQKVWQKEQEAELSAERKAGNEEKDDDDNNNNNNNSNNSNNKKKAKKEKQPVISKKDAIIAEQKKQREASDLDKDTQRIVNMKKVGGVKALVDIRNQIKTPIAKLELFLEILNAAVTRKDKELSFDVFWAIEAYELYQQAKAELSARKALTKSKEKDSKESKSKDSKDKKGKDKDSKDKDKGKEEKIPPKSPEAELLSKYKEVLKTVKEWRSSEDIIVFQLTNMSNRLPPLSPFTSDFRLDPWQKRVLKLIDARKSVVISAPTSSGKTVISTYVATLGRALNKEPTPPPTIPHRFVTINANGEEEEEIDGDEEENDTVVSTKDRVLFIVPTEPLVWQVAAHFARHILNGNVALVTDQMIYSPHSTLKEPPAVVVGTPAALETALTKIRGQTSILERNHLVDRAQVVGGFHHYGWVVYDEIHVLDGEEGEALQRLIRLMKCNFLALSATVGNAEDLRTWMEKVRGEQLNVEVINVPRNDDDNNNNSNNPETTSLSTNEVISDEDHKPPIEELLKRADIADTNRLVKLQIHEDRFINIQRHIWTRSEKTNQFELKPLHPLSAITIDFLKHKGFKSAALPMTPRDSYTLYTSMKRFYPKEVISELDPHNFFQSDDSNRITLRQSKDYEDKLKSKLEKLAHTHETETNQLLDQFHLNDLSQEYDVCELAFELKRQEKLPTLMFHLNVFELMKYFRELLEGIEAKQKEAYPNYYRNLQQKANAKKAMQEGVQREAKTNREVEDAQREGVIEDTIEVVDYTAPHPDFVFTPGAPISSREFEDICKEVKSRDRFEGDFAKHALMRALRRGIGIYINDHHFTAYRVAIMRLALQGKLGIVLSDSSLAYGVNMPFRSCVFCGEMGGLLNPILAQQMAGRSGRRGLDTEGHLIYLGARADFVRELMLAKIPAITGREPRYHTQFLQEMLSLYSNPKPLYPNQMDHLGGETLKDYVHSIHPDLLLENKKIVHVEDIILDHNEEKKVGEEKKEEVKVETNHLKLIEGVTVLNIPETDDIEYSLPNFRQVSIELLMELQLIEECDKLSPDVEEELRDAEGIDFNHSATISGYRPFQGSNFNVSDLSLNITCGQLWMIWELRNTLPDSITLGCMLPALYEEFIHRKSDPGEDVSSQLTFLLFLLFTVDRVPYNPSRLHSTVPLLEHPFVVARELKDKLVEYELKMLEIQNKIINLNIPLKKSLLQSYPIGEPLDSIIFETFVNPGIIPTLPHEVKAFLKEKYLSLSIKLAIMHNCLYRETSKYTKFEVLTRKCFATIQYISREMLQSIINFDDVSSADTERLG